MFETISWVGVLIGLTATYFMSKGKPSLMYISFILHPIANICLITYTLVIHQYSLVLFYLVLGVLQFKSIFKWRKHHDSN